jgi:hypothetical protein
VLGSGASCSIWSWSSWGCVSSVDTIPCRAVPETRRSGIALQFCSLNSGRHCRPDEGNAAELEGRKPTGNSNRQGSAPLGDEGTVPLLVVGTRLSTVDRSRFCSW